LKTHDLVEETHIMLTNIIELEDYPPSSSFSSLESQHKHEKLMRLLAALKKREDED